MRKKLIVLLTVLAVLAVSPLSMAEEKVIYETVDLKDGTSHTFNDNTYQDNIVRLDNSVTNDPGTHVDIVDGGSIFSISAYHNSIINISGGTIAHSVMGYHNSTINMSGGSIGNKLQLSTDGTVNITGGSIAKGIIASKNCHINMSGGSVSGRIGAHSNGIINLRGTGFEVTVDGVTTSLSNGDKLTDFGKLIENKNADYFMGTITGKMADGGVLDGWFRIHNLGVFEGTADVIITIVPTPAATANDPTAAASNSETTSFVLVWLSLGGIVLLGIGGFIFYRKIKA